MSWPWSELGLPGPAGLPEIRSAYARRLKTTHPEEDPEGFQRLHAAYQEASRYARRNRSAPAEDTQTPETSLSREAPPPPPETPEPREPEWDYGALLGEDAGRPPAVPLPEAPTAPEWDFERLFAEGEKEAREARRRRLEDLRRKNWARYVKAAYWQAESEETMDAVAEADRVLKQLYAERAPLSQWREFLESSLFLRVQTTSDFVFALEELLEDHSDISRDIRRAIFKAYEAKNGSCYQFFARLYRLLSISEKDRRYMAKNKGGNWFSRWRARSYKQQASTVTIFVVLAIWVFIGWSNERKEPEISWTEQAPQWLEEDYGEPFIHAVSGSIFAPAAEPELYFRASPYGERSEDWPGYQTNYPHILVRRALENFAAERELDLELADYTHDVGDAPGAYLLNLPLLGAEEDVAALGELLEELSRQDWYQVPPINPQSEEEYRTREPVKYTVYLCHKGLAFYEAPSDEGFDTEEALTLYAWAGPAFCRYILEDSGLAAEHLGEGAYELWDWEPVEMGGETFFQVRGMDKDSGQARVRYLLGSGGSTLFCIPEEEMGQIRSVVDLYRGTPRNLQLDKIGLVMVTDQVPKG